MGFKGIVEVNSEKCGEKEIAVLKQILPVFEWFAQMTRTRIVIGAGSAMRLEPIVQARDNYTVRVHLNAYPKCREAQFIFCGKTFFWQKIPKQLRAIEPVDTETSGDFVITPESHKLAFFSDKNMWVLFDCFNENWEKETLKKILFFTLFVGMPHALNSNWRWDADEYITEKEKTIARVLKQQFLKRREIIYQELYAFLEKNYLSQVSRVADLTAEYTESLNKAKTELFGMLNKELELNERLEYGSLGVNRDKIAEDFELLLRLENVETIRVDNTECVVVYTKTIYQSPFYSNYTGEFGEFGSAGFVPNTEEQPKNIGKFEIEIDPRQVNHSGIHFRQKRLGGDFEHAHAQANTCFGNTLDKGNLNAIISKHMQDSNIVAVVELCLSFLEKETTPPRKRYSSFDKNDDDIELVDKYVSEEERADEKRKFIETIEKVLLAKRTTQVQQELKTLRRLIEAKETYVAEYRLKINEITAFRHEIQTKFKDIKFYAKKELDALRRDPNLIWLKQNEQSLEIYLSLRKARNVCIVLYINKPPFVLGPFLSKDLADQKIIFEENKDSGKQIATLQRKGNISELISLIKQEVN